MKTSEALSIVLELAEQNIIPEYEMPAEHARQQEAINIVHGLRHTIKGEL